MQIQSFKYLIVAFVLINIGRGHCLASVPYAYAIRYSVEKLAGMVYTIARIDCFDLKTDTLIKTIPVISGANSATILDDNRVLICDTSDGSSAGIYIYNTSTGEKENRLPSKGVCPIIAIPIKDKIFVVNSKTRNELSAKDGNKHHIVMSWGCFEIFDKNSFKLIKTIDLRDEENIYDTISLNPSKSKLYFIGWNPKDYPDYSGALLGIINTINDTIHKQIDYGIHFGSGQCVVFGKNKLYVSAVESTAYERKKPEEKQILNNKLFVFNPDDLSLIKTIPIGILAEQMTYVPSVNRLYISHSSWDERTPQYIEVLDCETEKIIAKIPVKGFRMMSYVGNHKLYVSHSGGPLFGSDGHGGLLVIDVRTNKILKNIPGEYAPVAYNFDPIDEIK